MWAAGPPKSSATRRHLIRSGHGIATGSSCFPEIASSSGCSPPGIPGEVRAIVNGAALKPWVLDRPGLFVLEADIPQADGYVVDIHASPVWSVPTDDRMFSVNLSMIRLIEAD